MRAIILAAGRGTRLLPLTQSTPKPLVMVCRKPLLEHVIDALPKAVTDLDIVIGHLGSQIRLRYGDRIYGRRITYVEQNDLNGTAGALGLLRGHVRGSTLVVNADDLYAAPDLLQLSKFPFAILAKKTREPVQYPLTTGFLRRWKGFDPASIGGRYVWQNCGAYSIDERYFTVKPVAIPVRGGQELSLPHTLAQLTGQIPIRVVSATRWLPVGTHQELARANSLCASHFA